MVLPEEAAGWAGAGRAGQGSLPKAGLPRWRRVGSGRVGQPGEIGVCFLSLHLPSNT